tara:strand:- start:457 stop:852 length:396 start_codon:yes stop_codon:yes gene_type:complete
MKITGGCFCKQIQYTAEIDPETVTVCHCTDCQINSGTAYGVVVGVVGEGFRLLDGNLTYYEKIADSGARRSLAFCSVCGTRIYAKPADDSAGVFGLRVGTIDQRERLVPRRQAWSKSALFWVSDLKGLEKV